MNNKEQPDNNSNCNDAAFGQNTSVVSNKSSYQIARAAAFVSAVFLCIVISVMIYNHIIINNADILEPGKLTQLKAQLVKNPDNDALRNRIRDYDYNLRKEFFRRQELISRGRYMLLVGVIILLICLRYIHSLRPTDYSYLQATEAGSPNNRSKNDTKTNLTFISSAVVSSLLLLLGLFYVIFPGNYLGFVNPVITITSNGTNNNNNNSSNSKAGTNNNISNANTNNTPAWPSDREIKKNWPRFRGPSGLGISAYTNIPDSWDAASGTNILWKVPVALPGRNSPVVWGKRIFLTGATEKQRWVYCFDTDTGKLLWQKQVKNIPGTPPEPPEVSEDTGFASPTTVTDGKRIYALFANGNLACFDIKGNKVWFRNMGLPDSVYGFATSLVMYHNLLLIKYDQGAPEDGKSRLWAIDASNGKVAWQKKRPVANSWSTPIIAATANGKELITCADPWLIAYNPTTGSEIWKAKCLYGDVAPSPYYANGIVLAVKPSEELIALKANQKGDITDTGILWKTDEGVPDISSPLSDGKYVFTTTGETISCYNFKTGKLLWQKDMGVEFNASPSLVGNKVYFIANDPDGSAVIIKSADKYTELSRAKLGEPVYASPAFTNGRIYIRGKKHLFCITQTVIGKNTGKGQSKSKSRSKRE